ncbi:SUF system Fe-S cluster assembly protein [Acetobacteraceae bacterium ESL0709]|nr:SUF system Fe-S cluster assembly protein [Acetobacteraceae bacterium ESL0697]MDF7678321.1 SUF system Fe-S cluster assembly protein [Acetobacteraceae bacterium ESL0709]
MSEQDIRETPASGAGNQGDNLENSARQNGAELPGDIAAPGAAEPEAHSRETEPKEIGLPDQDEVIAAIATVYDPEIPVNIYELGLIYAIDLHDDGRVDIEMSLTAPNCPSAQELPEMIKKAVLAAPKVASVEVKIVWDPPWDMSRMSDDARLALNLF